MAGQLASLPLSLQLDSNGRPLAGCLLYLYDANTTTPAIFYEDFATTTVLSWPLVADAAGRIPMFWVVDGSYRVRLTDAAGNEVFNISSVTSVGASTVVISGGGGSNSQLYQTGDFIWQPIIGIRTGFVRSNGRTIGSGASGATERANLDCQPLFEWFWTNLDNTRCPVSGGRGATATADWNANKTIQTLDMRGILAFGLDDMGNSARGTVVGATTAGIGFGVETYTVPILQANLPSGINLSSASLTATPTLTATPSLTAASHTHGAGTYVVGTGVTVTNGATQTIGSATTIQEGAGLSHSMRENATTQTVTAALNSGSVSGASAASGSLAVSGTVSVGGTVAVGGSVPLGGSGTSLNVITMQPSRAGTWFVKL